MQRLRLLAAALLLLVPVSFARAPRETANLPAQDFQADLPSGTNLRLHLHDGDFRIVGGESDKITIHVDGKNVSQAKNIKVELKQSSDGVDLTLSHVPKNELQVIITIPKSTNLQAHMRGGDLTVEGVSGDKDLQLTGGDLILQIGSAEEYAQVDLSVRFGEVSGGQFGDPKGWMGNSIRREGPGKYKLHAHVMAGDLVLKS